MLTALARLSTVVTMETRAKQTAVAYFRTSSATNVGDDKDSVKRQRDAVTAYAAGHGLEITAEFYDAAVSGADPVTTRKGFNDMLAAMLANCARIVLVENASRFARDLVVQITGHDLLKAKGISLIPVDSPNHFEDETPTATMVRSILGAVSQFEKEALVLKLRKARDRKRQATGRCEGRTDWKGAPDAAVQAAKAAHARGLSLRAISAELLTLGLVNGSGKPYGAQSVALMVAREQCAKNRAARRVARKQA
jgi:DNA invertase Pin-like site-specific DNA recombinase